MKQPRERLQRLAARGLPTHGLVNRVAASFGDRDEATTALTVARSGGPSHPPHRLPNLGSSVASLIGSDPSLFERRRAPVITLMVEDPLT